MREVERNLKITTTGERFEDKQKPVLGLLCLHAQRRYHHKKEREEKAERRCMERDMEWKAASAQLEKEAEPAALQQELLKQTPTPLQASLLKACD